MKGKEMSTEKAVSICEGVESTSRESMRAIRVLSSEVVNPERDPGSLDRLLGNIAQAMTRLFEQGKRISLDPTWPEGIQRKFCKCLLKQEQTNPLAQIGILIITSAPIEAILSVFENLKACEFPAALRLMRALPAKVRRLIRRRLRNGATIDKEQERVFSLL